MKDFEDIDPGGVYIMSWKGNSMLYLVKIHEYHNPTQPDTHGGFGADGHFVQDSPTKWGICKVSSEKSGKGLTPPEIRSTFPGLSNDTKDRFKKSAPKLYSYFEEYYKPKPALSLPSPVEFNPLNVYFITRGLGWEVIKKSAYDCTNYEASVMAYSWKDFSEKSLFEKNGRQILTFSQIINDVKSEKAKNLCKQNSELYYQWLEILNQNFKPQQGSDFDIDKSNPRTKSEQEKVSGLSYLLSLERQSFLPYEYITGKAGLDQINSAIMKGNQAWIREITNNSLNNTHTNEQFKLPTKIRSLPGGERLTSSIVQGARCKNPVTKGYPVNRATVVAGRRPLRGR